MPVPGRTLNYPESFPESSRRPDSRFTRCLESFAIIGELSPQLGLAIVFDLPSEGLSVVKGSRDAHPELDTRPVYQLAGEGPPAVPTGKVWIERDLERVSDEALAALGYSIERVPGFAPQAAWLCARDGSIASALTGLEALAALEGVQAVQPEMLRPRVSRGRMP